MELIPRTPGAPPGPASTPAPLPENTGAGAVVNLVAAHARSAPDAIAIVDSGVTLTYGELDRRATQLAHRLRHLGVGREDLVGLCATRSAALVTGALGILKAGAAYVALDPTHPTDRLDFMIRDSGAEVVLAAPATAAQLARAGARFVDIDDLADADAPATFDPVPLTTRPGDRAYVIYTSGSTGAPKGVEIQHDGLLNLITWHRDAFAISPSDRATQIASPAFDAAVWEIWPYLAAGASIHIAPDPVRADPVAIRDWLLTEGITVSFLPTALAEAILTLDWPAESSLRYLLTGGDTLHHHPPAGVPFALINNYGPTEATVVATSGLIAPGEPGAGAPSIGGAITNVRLHIVDEQLREVPTGTIGELLIGGPGLARGYLGQPELTAERFIADPFAPASGLRLYRTGDHVRRRADGELEFHGRVDDQVQIRGHRVELGEVSAALHRHPGVRAAAVITDGLGPSGSRLVAYVVADEPAPSIQELRDHLARQLPVHMIPNAFVQLEAMPLTASHKVDRARLPQAAAVNAERPDDTVPPRNEVEEVLEDIVAELLELPQVGIDENFFMLGGHSLLGAQLIARITSRFGIEMSLRSLFDNPTVAAMAIEVEGLLLADLDALSDEEAARLLTTDHEVASDPDDNQWASAG